MKKRKTIIAAVVLLLVFMVGGAIAYFTDTDSATNTFTIGDIDISVTEPTWTTNLQADADYGKNVMPGETIVKDPQINNDSTANAAFVFAKVEIPCSTDSTPIEFFTLQQIGTGWTLMTDGACDATSHTATKIYNYGTASAMTSLAAGASTPAVFGSVKVNENINGSTGGRTGDQNVVVTGYGIQADGLTSTAPSAVWTDLNS